MVATARISATARDQSMVFTGGVMCTPIRYLVFWAHAILFSNGISVGNPFLVCQTC